MKFVTYFMAFILYASHVHGHEMTPTYFEIKPSYIDNVYSTSMQIFNRRADVKYYELQAFDEYWNKIPFASNSKILRIEYLKEKKVELYYRKKEKNKVFYVCSVSKILKGAVKYTAITSKICSKIK